jgi:hypothetical protein
MTSTHGAEALALLTKGATQPGSGASRRRRPSRWISLAGLGLALALAVALGLVQMRGVALPLFQETVLSDANTAPSERPPPVGAQQHLVYIDATEEQALQLRRLSAEFSALPIESRQAPVTVGVIIAGDGELPVEGLPAAPGTRFLDTRG